MSLPERKYAADKNIPDNVCAELLHRGFTELQIESILSDQSFSESDVFDVDLLQGILLSKSSALERVELEVKSNDLTWKDSSPHTTSSKNSSESRNHFSPLLLPDSFRVIAWSPLKNTRKVVLLDAGLRLQDILDILCHR